MPKTDPQQFERDVMPHLRLMMAMANRLTRNGSGAEDLVQDTLVKAFRAREQYREGTNFKAWLLTILRNTYLNGYRRQALNRRLMEGPDAGAINSGCLGAASMNSMTEDSTGLLKNELHGALTQALEELPEEFSSVVILADVEEMSYREIAEAMGCPLGTVMSRLYRGRRQLRSRLVEQASALGILPEQDAPATESSSDSTVALADYRKRKVAGK